MDLWIMVFSRYMPRSGTAILRMLFVGSGYQPSEWAGIVP